MPDIQIDTELILNLAAFTPEAIVLDPSSATSNEIVLDFLPEKPVPLPETSEILTQWVGDPPLEALGLATWWPSGRMQYLMEYLHVGFDLPWWAVIAASKLITINSHYTFGAHQFLYQNVVSSQ